MLIVKQMFNYILLVVIILIVSPRFNISHAQSESTIDDYDCVYIYSKINDVSFINNYRHSPLDVINHNSFLHHSEIKNKDPKLLNILVSSLDTLYLKNSRWQSNNYNKLMYYFYRGAFSYKISPKDSTIFFKKYLYFGYKLDDAVENKKIEVVPLFAQENRAYSICMLYELDENKLVTFPELSEKNYKYWKDKLYSDPLLINAPDVNDIKL